MAVSVVSSDNSVLVDIDDTSITTQNTDDSMLASQDKTNNGYSNRTQDDDRLIQHHPKYVASNTSDDIVNSNDNTKNTHTENNTSVQKKNVPQEHNDPHIPNFYLIMDQQSSDQKKQDIELRNSLTGSSQTVSSVTDTSLSTATMHGSRQNTQEQQSTQGFFIDDLLTTVDIQTNKVGNMENNIYHSTTTYTQELPSTPRSSGIGKKFMGLVFIILALGAAVAVRFVFKTMFPMGIGNKSTSNVQPQENTIQEVHHKPIGIFFSGENQHITPSTTEKPIENSTTEIQEKEASSGGDVQNIGETHSSATASDPQKLVQQLQNYQATAESLYLLGKEYKNKEMIKYGLYISRKAEDLLNLLASYPEIDISEIESYFAQFDTYLQRAQKEQNLLLNNTSTQEVQVDLDDNSILEPSSENYSTGS